MIPRCFVSADEWDHPVVQLSREDSHHLTDVLRIEPGAKVVVSNGVGGDAAAEVSDVRDGVVRLRILDRQVKSDAGVMITLIQAVPKATKMDWIIQKATEIGVWSIMPVMTDRGVVKLEDERADKRTDRWQRIAMEAAKQCRTAWIPSVKPVQELSHLLAHLPPLDVLLIGSLESHAVPLKDCLAQVKGGHPRSVGLLIGPEGDFSPREFELAAKAGALPVSYGNRVLRVETAALYGLCVLSYELSGF